LPTRTPLPSKLPRFRFTLKEILGRSVRFPVGILLVPPTPPTDSLRLQCPPPRRPPRGVAFRYPARPDQSAWSLSLLEVLRCGDFSPFRVFFVGPGERGGGGGLALDVKNQCRATRGAVTVRPADRSDRSRPIHRPASRAKCSGPDVPIFKDFNLVIQPPAPLVVGGHGAGDPVSIRRGGLFLATVAEYLSAFIVKYSRFAPLFTPRTFFHYAIA